MAYCNTILNQITAFFPRHEFEKLAKRHYTGQKFRSFNRSSQFLAMTIAQSSQAEKVFEMSRQTSRPSNSVLIIWAGGILV